jgi:hypothetical protein
MNDCMHAHFAFPAKVRPMKDRCTGRHEYLIFEHGAGNVCIGTD